MTTRKHVHQIELAASPEEVFRLLVSPNAIRNWWGASRVIVLAKQNGVWAAVWGNEDIPDYVALYKISAIEPPRRLFLTDSEPVRRLNDDKNRDERSERVPETVCLQAVGALRGDGVLFA